MIDLSIIIVSYNSKDFLISCIDSIKRYAGSIKYELIIVDNASSDGSVDEVKKRYKEVILIKNNENLGFGKANNIGIKIAKGEYILLLNSDTFFKKDILAKMVNWMRINPEIGISSCLLRNIDGSIQGNGGYFPTLFKVFAWMFFIEDIPLIGSLIKPFHPMHANIPFFKGDEFFKKVREFDWVSGAFFLIRNKVIKEVGYFDQDYFMYTEEVDYCFRAKKTGWRIVYNPDWYIVHRGGGSSAGGFSIISEFQGIKIFYKKHMSKLNFQFLRLFLKVGALLRIVVMGLIKGKEAIYVYKKAFEVA